jgi:hypothetical protein
MTYDVAVIVLVLSGTPILFLSILQVLKINKDLPNDLHGKWRASITGSI